MRCPPRDQTLLSARPREGFAVCCVSAALRACGGGEAVLRQGEIMLKMSLGVGLLQSNHENHRIIGWKRPLTSSPTINLTPSCLLNHALKINIYRLFCIPPGIW